MCPGFQGGRWNHPDDSELDAATTMVGGSSIAMRKVQVAARFWN